MALVAAILVACGGGNCAPTPTTVINPEWTWMSGANIADQHGVYGTQGEASPTNIPGARSSSISWSDKNGNLWLFGGFGNSTMTTTLLNDLWKYNTSTQQWTWVSGSNLVAQDGVYGIQGVPDTANIPGGRISSISWTDKDGNFWLFGGSGLDSTSTGTTVLLNDLWKYSTSTGQWTWVSGSKIGNQPGNYGTRGEASPTNIPSSRSQSISWIDNAGNLWLFGGSNDINTSSALNDLWKYDPKINQWTWMSGSKTTDQSGVYGTKSVADSANQPGSRTSSISWTDKNGNLWLFGGMGYAASGGDGGFLNDLWKYNTSTGQWTWMSGSNIANQPGNYGTQGVANTINVPGARGMSQGWSDANGNLWLFGGQGFINTSDGGFLNDLWLYTPNSGQWTWVSGSNLANQPGNYGTQGVDRPTNISGAKQTGITWTDTNNNLWLFGGQGVDINGNSGYLNDLWVIKP